MITSGDASGFSIWSGENGILENAQVLFLLVTLIRYLSLWATSAEVLRSMFAALALIAMGCMLRELDFDSNGPFGAFDQALKGPIRITVIFIAIPIVAIAVKNLLQTTHRLSPSPLWNRVGSTGHLRWHDARLRSALRPRNHSVGIAARLGRGR